MVAKVLLIPNPNLQGQLLAVSTNGVLAESYTYAPLEMQAKVRDYYDKRSNPKLK